MNQVNDLVVEKHSFTPALIDEVKTNRLARDLWPLVYILSSNNTRIAYVGETTDTAQRMATHLKNEEKAKLSTVRFISSSKFNKSATLDIESNLIRYMSGDGKFKLLNGNLGLANHNYYQKQEIYWDAFKNIWNHLRADGIASHSLTHIDNSDLFKYSPYKSLTSEQTDGLKTIIESLLNPINKRIIIEGGAGTGKTILAIFLFKLMSNDLSDFSFKEFGENEDEFIDLSKRLNEAYKGKEMAIVVPMASFRETVKKVFRKVSGLNAKMVIGPAEVASRKYDLLLVDESHRLRRRVNLGAYYGSFDKACAKLNLDKSSVSELDWVLKQSRKSILFYDEDQSIKPSDTRRVDFDILKRSETTVLRHLKNQFRVKAGNDYVKYIKDLLDCKLSIPEEEFSTNNYEFLFFDSINKMADQIKQRNKEYGLSRLIAGYSWEWISKKDRSLFDIKIGSTSLKWNSTSKDWINSPNSINEVGCIHTTQGYDLNYAGIIFGNEIDYDDTKNEIVIIPENYHDRNGKQTIKNPAELKNFILNIYKTILLRGIRGTYVYACNQGLRNYLSSFIPCLNKEEARKIDFVPPEEIEPYINSIPLYDLKVAAGEFGEFQEVEEVRWISIPDGVQASKDLFVCQIVGESMNKVIPNGSYCLFKKYSGGSRNGQIVLVEHTNLQDPEYGSCYTVKEYESKKHIDSDSWEHTSIILKPLSYSNDFIEIDLSDQDDVSLRVIGTFVQVLG